MRFPWKKKGASEDKTERTDRLLRLLFLIGLTATVMAVYRFLLNEPYFLTVMIVYMAIFTAFLLAYVFYNRGFSRRNVTEDQLPDSWSEEQRREYVEDGKRRMDRSRWMLIPILAFGLTLAFDAMELFVLPFFENLF